jgi:nucleoside-diphosphate-sugar epimerase
MRPQEVFLAAAKVGGIVANNTLRGEFLYDNLIIAANVIQAAQTQWRAEKLMFPPASIQGWAAQPLREDSILMGPLEQTNEPCAIARIAGIKMVEAYRAPRREFLYVDDLADACIHLMKSRVRARGRGCRRLHRRGQLRPLATRQHAAQITRCQPPCPTGLARAHLAPRRSQACLSGVPG